MFSSSALSNLRASCLSNNTHKSEQQTDQSSLCAISKQIINYVRYQPIDRVFSISELAVQMNVKKRRIYDILNVLEGMGYVKKTLADSIVWLGHRRPDIDYEQEARLIKLNLNRLERVRSRLMDFKDSFSQALACLSESIKEEAQYKHRARKAENQQVRIQPFLIIRKGRLPKRKRERSGEIEEPAIRKLAKMTGKNSKARFECKVCHAVVNFAEKDRHKRQHV